MNRFGSSRSGSDKEDFSALHIKETTIFHFFLSEGWRSKYSGVGEIMEQRGLAPPEPGWPRRKLLEMAGWLRGSGAVRQLLFYCKLVTSWCFPAIPFHYPQIFSKVCCA